MIEKIYKVEKNILNKLKKISKISRANYSNFKVVALFVNKDNSSFYGINIENVSYPNSLCAERVGLFSAINNQIPTINVEKVYIYSPNSKDFLAPCGECRQTMSELMNHNFEIIMMNKNGEYIKDKFTNVFPYLVNPKNIKGIK